MPKWTNKRKTSFGDYTKRKRNLKPTYPNGINHTFKLYKKKETHLSNITTEEREFFIEWVRSRNLEDEYLVLALTYWMRIKPELGVYFVIKKKEFYMIICIHIALKWLGYDEVFKCNFIKDLRDISDISPVEHSDMEYQVLNELSWDL